jgi:hypothetical protein
MISRIESFGQKGATRGYISKLRDKERDRYLVIFAISLITSFGIFKHLMVL